MEVKLKRNGWHKRLQVWTFGEQRAPQFNSLCPFFWTTVFCAFVSPFVATYKYLIRLPLVYLAKGLTLVVGLLLSAIESLIQYVDVEVCQPMYEQKVSGYVDNMTDEDALDVYLVLYDMYDYNDDVRISDKPYVRSKWEDNKNKVFRTYKDKLDRWKSKVGDEWKVRLQELAEQREKRRLEEKKLMAIWEAEQEAKKKRWAKSFNIIAYYTKYLLYLALGVAGVYALYFLALAGLFLYEVRASIFSGFSSFFSFIVNAFVVGGPYVLGGVAILAVLIPLGIFVVKLLVKCNLFQVKHNPNPSKLYLFLSKIANGIGSVIEFCVMYAKAAKQNYCPHIDWEE